MDRGASGDPTGVAILRFGSTFEAQMATALSGETSHSVHVCPLSHLNCTDCMDGPAAAGSQSDEINDLADSTKSQLAEILIPITISFGSSKFKNSHL